MSTPDHTPSQKPSLQSLIDQCVHCGMCNATCPTYQVSGDENDGPRGRIYRVSQLQAPNAPVSQTSRDYFENCLQCRNCETTCPSGVQYADILHAGLEQLDQQHPRPRLDQLKRQALDTLLSQPKVFATALALGQGVRPLLPQAIRQKVPPKSPYSLPTEALPTKTASSAPAPTQSILLLGGCVQPAISPNTDKALTQLLALHGIETRVLPTSRCCGAAQTHLYGEHAGQQKAKEMLDACSEQLDSVDAVVMSASGCMAHLIHYVTLLADDAHYRPLAERFQAKLKDPIALVEHLAFELTDSAKKRLVAFHAPCTARNALKTAPRIEAFLRKVGYQLALVDAPLCCGSAGVQSVLKPQLAQTLRASTLKGLSHQSPELIMTANVGCQSHLGGGSERPVVHYLEQLAVDLTST